MSRKYKTSHKVYTAWNYEKEIEDLNKQSEKGWQLVHGGMFGSRFKFDDSVCYRYQIDYRPKIEEKGRYIDTFRDSGWEYVNSTANGWHYFRKVYDPTRPDEEYEIFTDRESLKEMNNRWAKLAIVVCVLLGLSLVPSIIRVIIHPILPAVVQAIAFAVEFAILLRGAIIMKNPDSRKNRKGDSAAFSIFIICVLVALFGSNALSAARPNLNANMSAEYMDSISAEFDDALLWNTVNIEYRDNYILNVSANAEKPVKISLVSSDGEVVYQTEGTEINEERIILNLRKGVYNIYVSDFDGGAMDMNFEII